MDMLLINYDGDDDPAKTGTTNPGKQCYKKYTKKGDLR
jgi:hypothetical protein